MVMDGQPFAAQETSLSVLSDQPAGPAVLTTRRVEYRRRFAAAGPALELVLPVWTPGSYLVREYARHLQDLTAADAAGKPLPCRRVDKRTFRIETQGAAEVVARWRVYANDLTVRSSHFDD